MGGYGGLRGDVAGDTIAAVATAAGDAAIGIVRVSGPQAIEVVGRVFRRPGGGAIPREGNRVWYGHIVDPEDGRAIDEVLVSVFKAPRSYTREDVVEIGCHGGFTSVRRVLEILLRSGARAAEPGEFTRRAFINGRIDLAQAEAVLDLIRAKTELQADLALRQVRGGLSKEIRGLREEIVRIMAEIEASIDFPEDVEEPEVGHLCRRIEEVRRSLEGLIRSSERGKIIRDGVRVPIVGRPNVGKSSLLNALLREERAIVTDIPGTTRDTIEAWANVEGIPFLFVDTAGLRESSDEVERIGVQRAVAAARGADAILFVVDDTEGVTVGDVAAAEGVCGERTLVVVNKVDAGIGAVKDSDIAKMFPKKEMICGVVRVSARTGEGLDVLETALVEAVLGGGLWLGVESGRVATSVRQMDALRRAYAAVSSAVDGLHGGVPLDLVSGEMRVAGNALGEITGETVGEDVLDRVFRDFCVGK